LQGVGDREAGDVVGEEDQQHRGDADDPRQHQHLLAPDAVGQAAGGQLQRHHDDALQRHGDADLGQGQAAVERQQHEHRDHQADRQPAQRGQHQEPPVHGDGGELVGHRGGFPPGSGNACR
jgi:hypothetical protein